MSDDTQDLRALILSLPREVYLPHPITGIATACHPYIAPRQNGGPGNDDWEFGFQTEIGETFLHPATGRDLRQMIGFLMPFIRRLEVDPPPGPDDDDDPHCEVCGYRPLRVR